MSKEQPEALPVRLAKRLCDGISTGHDWPNTDDELLRMQSASELRRLHAENEALRAQIGQVEPDDAAAKERDRILSALKRHDWHSSNIWRYYYPSSTGDWVDLRELRKLLASSPPAPQAAVVQQEPFGCVTVVRRIGHSDEYHFYKYPSPPYLDNASECHALYTRPAPQEKQPLTEEQIRYSVRSVGMMFTAPDIKIARAIEAAHGIKGE